MDGQPGFRFGVQERHAVPVNLYPGPLPGCPERNPTEAATHRSCQHLHQLQTALNQAGLPTGLLLQCFWRFRRTGPTLSWKEDSLGTQFQNWLPRCSEVPETHPRLWKINWERIFSKRPNSFIPVSKLKQILWILRTGTCWADGKTHQNHSEHH